MYNRNWIKVIGETMKKRSLAVPMWYRYQSPGEKMKTQKITLLVVGVMLLSLFLAACGSTSSTAKFPTGELLRADNQSRGLQFNADGTFVVLDGTMHLVEGTYSAKGGIYTEESNNAGCPTPMHYKYTFQGVNLKFYPVEDPAKDPCGGRKEDFSETQTWVLTK